MDEDDGIDVETPETYIKWTDYKVLSPHANPRVEAARTALHERPWLRRIPYQLDLPEGVPEEKVRAGVGVYVADIRCSSIRNVLLCNRMEYMKHLYTIHCDSKSQVEHLKKQVQSLQAEIDKRNTSFYETLITLDDRGTLSMRDVARQIEFVP